MNISQENLAELACHIEMDKLKEPIETGPIYSCYGRPNRV